MVHVCGEIVVLYQHMYGARKARVYSMGGCKFREALQKKTRDTCARDVAATASGSRAFWEAINRLLLYCHR